MKKYIFKKRRLILLIAGFDILGTILSWPFKFFNRGGKPKNISRILLIRLDHVGDVIMSTAILKPLREAFPKTRIDFLVADWAHDLLKDNPNIDNVIRFKPVWFDRLCRPHLLYQIKDFIRMVRIINNGRYDVAIDLKGDLRHILALFLAGVKYRLSYGITGGEFLLSHRIAYHRGIHETEYSLNLVRALGVNVGKVKADLSLNEEAKQKADRILKEHGVSQRFAVFHILSGHDKKNWDNKKFSHLIDYVLDKKGFVSVFIGEDKDRKAINDIIPTTNDKVFNLAGETDLGALAGIINKAFLFVGLDSAPAHIAASFGIPSVILFSGINDIRQWAPQGENIRLIYPGPGRDLSFIDYESVCRVIDQIIL